jgi:dienelactone hydrolase
MRPVILFLFLISNIGYAIADDAEHLAPHMELVAPAEAGSYPAVMMLSGCSGFSDGYRRTAQDIKNLGFVVIFVDSLAARGEERCNSRGVSREDQINDMKEAANYLRKLPIVQNQSITALGYSWGGGAVMAAAVLGDVFDRAIAYFPFCKEQTIGPVKVPSLVLHGEADDVNPISSCAALYSASVELLDVRTYPDAHHAFHAVELGPPKQYRSGTLGYHEAAAVQAWRALEVFLTQPNIK